MIFLRKLYNKEKGGEPVVSEKLKKVDSNHDIIDLAYTVLKKIVQDKTIKKIVPEIITKRKGKRGSGKKITIRLMKDFGNVRLVFSEGSTHQQITIIPEDKKLDFMYSQIYQTFFTYCQKNKIKFIDKDKEVDPEEEEEKNQKAFLELVIDQLENDCGQYREINFIVNIFRACLKDELSEIAENVGKIDRLIKEKNDGLRKTMLKIQEQKNQLTSLKNKYEDSLSEIKTLKEKILYHESHQGILKKIIFLFGSVIKFFQGIYRRNK